MSGEDPTPKESGTLGRWPILAAWARQAAGQLRARGRHQDAEQADLLAMTFESWGRGDPGGDARRKSITLLMTLRERAGIT